MCSHVYLLYYGITYFYVRRVNSDKRANSDDFFYNRWGFPDLQTNVADSLQPEELVQGQVRLKIY